MNAHTFISTLRFHLPLIILVAVALIIRFWTIGYGTNVDEGDYLMQGREWVQGHWPYLDVHLNKPPLMSILAAPFFWFWQQPFIPVRVAMILISTSALLAAYLLGHQLHSKVVGITAASIIAFDPYMAIWAKYIHVSTLMPVLSLWSFTALVIGLKQGKSSWLITSGFITSLCLLNKQTGVAILPVLLCAVFLLHRPMSFINITRKFLCGFLPLPIIVCLTITIIGAWQDFIYDIYYGNIAMASFFNDTLQTRWQDFKNVAFWNPIPWWVALAGVLVAIIQRNRLAFVIILWLAIEFWLNIFGLSHVWAHYIMAIMPSAYLLAALAIGSAIQSLWSKQNWPQKLSPVVCVILAGLICIPFWPRANWSYPNLTLEDERAIAVHINRQIDTAYFLNFANSAFYIWTNTQIPTAMRNGDPVRIPPFMNTAGRKYLSFEDMQDTAAHWQMLDINYCVMYGKYYQQIFVAKDPHLEPIRLYLEENFTQTQVIDYKPTYYAQLICFERKTP